MTTYLAPFLSGTAFGAALTISSTYLPGVILDQFALRSTYMLTTVLTASACSAIIIYLSNKLGFANLMYRKHTTYGWFGRYDANLIGGMLQGIGMALTGACPGTVLVQVALGIKPALWVLVGGLMGAMIFIDLAPKIRKSVTSTSILNETRYSESHTLAQKFETSEGTAAFAYATVLVAVILAMDVMGFIRTHGTLLSPVFGGLLIAIAQLISIILSKKTLGVSSAYSDIAESVYCWMNGSKSRPGYTNTFFAMGVMFGARLISRRLSLTAVNSSDVNLPSAILGGTLSIFGARLAGGCTSGHGISGTATGSISSIITAGSMFVGGIVFKQMSMVVSP